MNKIIKVIIDIVFIVVIVLLVCYLTLKALGIVNIFEVKTGSMETGIHIGDYIMSVKSKSYEIGDIVTYRYEGSYVTHRIVEIDNDKVITKGDANNIVDEEVLTKNIVGKVIYSGGILNIIFRYKFFLIAIMLTMYLVSCYINVEK